MKHVLLISALFATQATPAQERFVSYDMEAYYEWFHEQSQVADHYEANSTLYTFVPQTKVHEGPCQSSAVLASLPAGQAVTNIGYADSYYLPEDEIDGYNDFWYHVRGKDTNNRSFSGYVWGAQIAKSWKRADLTGDGQAEFLMLGIASSPRKSPRDIKAEVRMLKDGKLIAAKEVPSLCVFEACGASTLLRVVKTAQGFPVIEASTMAIGCWAGLEKAFLYFDGSTLARVYHAEYTTQHEFANEAFTVKSGDSTQMCRYSHESESHEPVWACKAVSAGNGRAAVALQERDARPGR